MQQLNKKELLSLITEHITSGEHIKPLVVFTDVDETIPFVKNGLQQFKVGYFSEHPLYGHKKMIKDNKVTSITEKDRKEFYLPFYCDGTEDCYCYCNRLPVEQPKHIDYALKILEVLQKPMVILIDSCNSQIIESKIEELHTYSYQLSTKEWIDIMSEEKGKHAIAISFLKKYPEQFRNEVIECGLNASCPYRWQYLDGDIRHSIERLIVNTRTDCSVQDIIQSALSCFRFCKTTLSVKEIESFLNEIYESHLLLIQKEVPKYLKHVLNHRLK